MDTKKTVEAINKLIVINNDRIEGYQTASKETEEQDLKLLFAQFMSTSAKLKQELEREVQSLDGEEAEGTKITGKFFRVWMDVKAALTGKDRKAILSSCEFGEDKALQTYDDVLEDYSEHLTIAQRTMIVAQRELLFADHNHVKSLRDSLVNA